MGNDKGGRGSMKKLRSTDAWPHFQIEMCLTILQNNSYKNVIFFLPWPDNAHSI